MLLALALAPTLIAAAVAGVQPTASEVIHAPIEGTDRGDRSNSETSEQPLA